MRFTPSIYPRGEAMNKTMTFDELCRRTMKPRSIRRAKSRARGILRDMMLKELREALGLSQRDLSRKLKLSQPSVWKLERQADMQVATLRRVVRALGGDIEIIARFPAADVRIVLPSAA